MAGIQVGVSYGEGTSLSQASPSPGVGVVVPAAAWELASPWGRANVGNAHSKCTNTRSLDGPLITTPGSLGPPWGWKWEPGLSNNGSQKVSRALGQQEISFLQVKSWRLSIPSFKKHHPPPSQPQWRSMENGIGEGKRQRCHVQSGPRFVEGAGSGQWLPGLSPGSLSGSVLKQKGTGSAHRHLATCLPLLSQSSLERQVNGRQ